MVIYCVGYTDIRHEYDIPRQAYYLSVSDSWIIFMDFAFLSSSLTVQYYLFQSAFWNNVSLVPLS